MKVFIDTSAFLAVLSREDRYHPKAAALFERELASTATLLTSNYVLLETSTLLQHRLGLGALRTFESAIVPAMKVLWVDKRIHQNAVSSILNAGRRKLSLVDCTSFELMRTMAIDTCFTFDKHFKEQGFQPLR